MKRFLLLISTYACLCNVESQDLSAMDFLFSSSFSPKKFETFLSKKKYVHGATRLQQDTLVTIYTIKGSKKKNVHEPIIRKIETYQFHNNFSVGFLTSSLAEFNENKKKLTKSGFFCGNENDTEANAYLFQRRNLSVWATINRTEEDTLYSFKFQQAELPSPEKVQYAEDLLQFYSHEWLVSFFGEKNVIKDIYYFLDKRTSKCSVLFPHSNRQAVFIWDDEINLCKPASVLVGGNITTAELQNYDGVIFENVWNSKEGVYSGMSLSNLVKLNGTDFKFYGKNSKSPYMVLPENTGALDFKKSRVVLGCLNLNGDAILNRSVVSTDEILDYNSSMFVFMLMILPSSSDGNKDSVRR